MLITMKSLRQHTFQIEVDDSETVQQLKDKIEMQEGETYASVNQTLIYNGIVLDDVSLLSTYNIDPAKFMVVMMKSSMAPVGKNWTKPRHGEVKLFQVPDATSVTSLSLSSDSNSLGLDSTLRPSSSISSGRESRSTPPPLSPVPGANDDKVFNANVERLTEMGYNPDEVKEALFASFNDPAKAVEYLISGIPSIDVEGLRNSFESMNVQRNLAADPDNPLAFLRSIPQFQEMRSLIRHNPQLMSVVMRQVGTAHPDLISLIREHQQIFIRMLNEPLPPMLTPPPVRHVDGVQVAGGHHILDVNQAEKDAIDRLKAMGFPEQLVIQAYFACDKDENQAANFLLSHGND